MLNVSAKWQRAVMLDNDINVNCFTDIVTASGEKIPMLKMLQEIVLINLAMRQRLSYRLGKLHRQN